MTSYFLFTPNFSNAFNGSYAQCLQLATQLTNDGTHELLKMARARAGETDATIIFDITAYSSKQTKGVRSTSRHTLQKTSKESPFRSESDG